MLFVGKTANLTGEINGGLTAGELGATAEILAVAGGVAILV